MRRVITTALWIGLVLLVAAATGVQASPSGQANPVHCVRKGDTLSGIASRYDSSVSAIMRANGLRSSLIIPNQCLVVPVGSSSSYTSTGSTGSAGPGTTGPSYVVRSGDTLSEIALAHGVTVSALRATNGIAGDRIYAGQALVIPPGSGGGGGVFAPVPGHGGAAPLAPSRGSCGSSYRVQKGDTLSGIASRCGTTVGAIQAANGLSGTAIYAGRVLTIPGSSSRQRPAATPSSPRVLIPGTSISSPTPTPTVVPAFELPVFDD